MKVLSVALSLSLLAASSASAQLLTPAPSPVASPQIQTAASTAVASPARIMEQRDIAVLQILDKVSARVTTLRVPVSSSAAFGLIFVTARSCQVSLPSDTPEAAAFLEISEVDLHSLPRSEESGRVVNSANTQRLLFTGLMFASSPALSALEHPTYDVTVLGCEAKAVTAATSAASGEEGTTATTESTTTPSRPTTPPAAAAEAPLPED